MSELKGQLLGIILVLGLFAVVSATAYAIFNATSKSITSKIEDVTGQKIDIEEYK